MINIFVFGSNLAGRHGKGATLSARKNHGAVYGQGIGLQGNSYGIPTKDRNLRTLPISEIKIYVDEFISFAKENKQYIFKVTPIGCGLAGYRYDQIAPLFEDIPNNVNLPEQFKTKGSRLKID